MFRKAAGSAKITKIHSYSPRSTTLGFAVFFLLAISIATLEVLDRSNPLRWLTYAVPVLALIASIQSQNIRLSGPAPVIVAFSIAFILSIIANIDEIDLFYAGRDAIIYSLILMTLFVRLPITGAQIFFSMCCTFFLVFTSLILGKQMNVSLLYGADTLRGESSASIVYAALAIFFLINRQLLFATISFIFAIFTFKRTSYVYFVITLACWIIVEFTIAIVGSKYRKICITASTVILYSACFTFSFYLLDAIRFVQETFFPHTPLHEFTTGRSGLYLMIMNVYENSDLRHIIFGYGPGSIEKLILEKLNLSLAHNEFLHHFLDYGAMGIIFFGAFILTIVNIRIKYYPIAFYLVLVSLTDNPFYVFIISIPIICLFSMEIDDSRRI
jgi:O-antigen ligase